MTKLKYACSVIWFGCALLTVSMLAADERVVPESALRWQPREYPEATLHARVPFLHPQRDWERLDVWVPKSPAEGKLPCVVAIFGGGYGDKSPGFIKDVRPLLNRGFVVAAPDYALQTDAPVPLCAWDVANAIRFLRAHADDYRIDPERIGVWGWSAGGWIAQDLCYAGPQRSVHAPAKVDGQKVPRWFPMLQPHPQFADQSVRVQAVVSDWGAEKLWNKQTMNPQPWLSPDDPPLFTCYNDAYRDDPATAPLLKKARNADGKPCVCEGAWISYYTGRGEENGEGFGKLTTGYGSRLNPSKDGGKIGPEFTFGLTMDETFNEPVLIIKTAWGGKSLFYDFRPPSAGVFPRTEADIEKERRPESGSGHYYRLMLKHVKHVLGDIRRVVPDYDPEQGYEIAGFVWFQGFNDMVSRDVYPELSKDSEGNRFAKYSEWMADFIRDVRKDLDVPNMPFVIGVMGVGGDKANEGNLEFRKAMAAPAALPEFKGNVVAVPTFPFWDEPLAAIQAKYEKVRQMAYLLRTENKNAANADGSMSKEEQRAYLRKYEAELVSPEEVALPARGASNAGYHYLGCAKTFALMGEAFAKANLEMRGQHAKR